MTTTRPIESDSIVIGAGAAGLFCAATAGGRGRRVVVLEHGPKPGAKILISGGGRCNFTNLDAGPDRFLSANPHFCKSALSRYDQHDFVDMVRRHGIAFHEKTLGQLFCDGSAREILAMLLTECAVGGVDIRLSHRITEVGHDGSRFRVATERGTFLAPRLVMATGGPSIPKMGATAFAHDVARQFGLRVVEPRPALVPFTLDATERAWTVPLSGVALGARVACGKARFDEAVLFTHRGLSGPAILQVSSYWQPGAAITLDMAPGTDTLAFLKDRKDARPKAEVRSVLAEILPARLAQALAGEQHRPIGETGDKILRNLSERISRWRVVPDGTEGFAKAEVAAGGVDTRDLSSRTMEANGVPGLHFIGEAVDVTGWLGGYNFQWAWSSGHAAATAF
ncbi:NAD(P)/FAD-dependent oxidoreductase [Zavarzinia compransoris]|uniref:NAD(P)/FAD-dependent oxidoreductase n=1 Tax=Zavarzinia marina TaxID=2911065 RepID=UPI001F2D25DF|nr:NAD(P)/FAD-dependent oxidoreductase [Zavarzinia marina]MCF4165258.1 NAD(P)/FAD-dependent oxidoreductase [Zavarzinia marina]